MARYSLMILVNADWPWEISPRDPRFCRICWCRADFVRRMAQYTPEQLGFLDKVSKDERTSFRTRGRSFKGTRAVQKGVFVRGWRFSAKGLLSLDGMISCTVVEGSMTRARFLEYLEQSVVSCSLVILAFCVTYFIRCLYVHLFWDLWVSSLWIMPRFITAKAFYNLHSNSVRKFFTLLENILMWTVRYPY